MKDSRANEAAFETVSELHFLANGYQKIDRKGYEKELTFFCIGEIVAAAAGRLKELI